MARLHEMDQVGVGVVGGCRHVRPHWSAITPYDRSSESSHFFRATYLLSTCAEREDSENGAGSCEPGRGRSSRRALVSMAELSAEECGGALI